MRPGRRKRWARPEPLRSITYWIDRHAAERPDCRACDGTGLVCEAHPNLPWGPVSDLGCPCGECGMECLLIHGEQVATR